NLQLFPGTEFKVQNSIVKFTADIDNNAAAMEIREGSLDIDTELTMHDGSLRVIGGGSLTAQYVTVEGKGSIDVNFASMVVQRDLLFARANGNYGSLTVHPEGRIDILRNATIPIPVAMVLSQHSPLIYVEGNLGLSDTFGMRSSLTVLLD